MGRSNNPRIILPLVIVAGVLTGLMVLFGEQVLAFATGQDILTELHTDLQTNGSGQPFRANNPSTGGSDTAESISYRSVGLAPDGFPVEPRQHVLRYTVQQGDTVFSIAERFGLSPNTVFWSNTETLEDNINLLYIGVELYILPVDGVYHLSDGNMTIGEIAATYGVTPGDILYSEYNTLSKQTGSFVPPPGLHIVVPGGRREYVSWRSPIRTGAESGRANPEGAIHPGSCLEFYQGAGGLGEYINPVGPITYRVTNGFATYHPGVDLAADRGTPIYAAETGVVVFAGYHRNGYGELVILDHGNGWTTYYAHMSTRFVDCGDQLPKGQILGEMGMTGNATGIHLHFEIRENDLPLNPYNFIEIRDVRNNTTGN
jgi:murein DD-endopeptidase MepM/ murein hydrolase activator NlpD